MQNGTQQFGGQQQTGGGFGTFSAKNRPPSQQNVDNVNENGNQVGANGGGSRPLSALSQGQGGGGSRPTSALSSGGQGGGFGSRGGGTSNNGNEQAGDQQQQENGSSKRDPTPQPQQSDNQQAPAAGEEGKRANFGSQRGSGFGGRRAQADGGDGTDFGDGPKKPVAGTGANTAPLGVRGSGFGGRGARGAATGNGGDGTNSNAAAETTNESGEANGDNNNRRQSGFGGSAARMGGRGGGGNVSFGDRGGRGGNAIGGRGGDNFARGGDREGGEGGNRFNDRQGGNRYGDREGGGNRFGDREGGGNRFGDREGGGNRFGFGGRAGESGGSYSRFSQQYENSDECERQASHVPIDRTIAEIVEEDTRVAENYKTIAEEDDECIVTGLSSETPQQMLDNWADANFEEQILKNIERSAYLRPRKIQSLTIPLIMDGHDIKGHAETGSGKSAAFLLPIIDTIMKKKKSGEYESKRICPYCLIIEPTRELAYQLYDQARKLAEKTGVTVSKTYGKFKVKENTREISSVGCDILVGTPGRLLHFFEVKYLESEKLKMLVLDEADQLLEDDFVRILRQLPKVEGFPKIEDRQTLLFSATFAPEVQQWANDWLKKENVMVSNKKPITANSRVVQKFLKVERAQKNQTLKDMLLKEAKEAEEENPANPVVKRTLVFVKMKRTADLVSTFLNLNGVLKTTTINGDRPQKLREESLNHFRTGKFTVVVTTDVCARGIDIKELDHVINLDLPIDYTSYVHRIGRTGRLKEGIATSFFDPSDDMELAKELVEGLKSLGQDIEPWLQDAADGKLPVVEDLYTQNSWGAGFGSCFGANNKEGEQQQAAAWNKVVENGITEKVVEAAENGVENGTTEKVVEAAENGVELKQQQDKKESADENSPPVVEAPLPANGPTQAEQPVATSFQQPAVNTQPAAAPENDPNDDW